MSENQASSENRTLVRNGWGLAPECIPERYVLRGRDSVSGCNLCEARCSHSLTQGGSFTKSSVAARCEMNRQVAVLPTWALAVASAFLFLGIASAIPQNSESATALSSSELRQVNEEMGITASDARSKIQEIDSHTLSSKGQIFVVAEAKRCISVGIFARTLDGLQRIWTLDKTPSGKPICSVASCPPATAFAPAAGVVNIRYAPAADNRGCTVRWLRYEQKAENYQLSNSRESRVWFTSPPATITVTATPR
jgi:hypothetical protein